MKPSSPPSALRAATPVVDEVGIGLLAARIVDPDRQSPVVLLTTRPGDREPAIDPQDVREVVGSDIPVYCVATGPLTRALERALPPKLQAYGGAARIWWPGVSASSDPHEHPLVFDRYGVYGTKAVAAFAEAFRRGAPKRARELADPERELLVRERDSARVALRDERQRSACLERELDEARKERDRARRENGETRRRVTRTRLASPDASHLEEPRADEAGDELAFRRRVLEAWFSSLTADDRARHPLGTYRLHRSFLSSMREVAGVDAGRVAWVCAMVASGRARELSGLEVHALRAGDGGDDPRRERPDGAKAMRCALKRGSPGAPRLHYWVCSDGIIEFACVVHHDTFSIPE